MTKEATIERRLAAISGHCRQRHHRGEAFSRKAGANHMNALYPFRKSPRCKATSKRTKKPCRAPAMNGWTVCRFTARGVERRRRHGMYRHGDHTKEAVALRRQISELQRETRALLSRLS